MQAGQLPPGADGCLVPGGDVGHAIHLVVVAVHPAQQLRGRRGRARRRSSASRAAMIRHVTVRGQVELDRPARGRRHVGAPVLTRASIIAGRRHERSCVQDVGRAGSRPVAALRAARPGAASTGPGGCHARGRRRSGRAGASQGDTDLLSPVLEAEHLAPPRRTPDSSAVRCAHAPTTVRIRPTGLRGHRRTRSGRQEKHHHLAGPHRRGAARTGPGSRPGVVVVRGAHRRARPGEAGEAVAEDGHVVVRFGRHLGGVGAGSRVPGTGGSQVASSGRNVRDMRCAAMDTHSPVSTSKRMVPASARVDLRQVATRPRAHGSCEPSA